MDDINNLKSGNTFILRISVTLFESLEMNDVRSIISFLAKRQCHYDIENIMRETNLIILIYMYVWYMYIYGVLPRNYLFFDQKHTSLL